MSQAAGKPDGSDSPARKSCMFYKLMVASILHDKKLKIPKKFVNKYGDELSSIAALTVPCGGICLVELQKVNGKLWFHKGWHEFVECYSIRVGYFLVFLYEGKSNFNVHIPPSPNLLSSITSKNFNEHVHCNWTQSTCTAGLKKPHVRADAYNLRENCQSSRDIGTQFNGGELASVEDGVGSIISGITAKTRGSKRMNADKHESLGIQNMKQKSTRVKNTSETLTRRQRAVTPEEKEGTIRAAHMFRPDNPFFQVILRPSYVYRGFLLHIPSSFARTFLNRVTGFVTLQVCDGKQWPVRCSFKDGKAKLGQGWTEFVWENNLEEGDVCIFELIHAKEIVMKVAIFRVLEDAVPTDHLPN
ncbi:hypothetical protein SADUNF_Sadunf04G0097300 [Salix dunnii]|uniref:TF-B3 domain-containing protein n=1 Tax=Salix dunnii TaxID=1413687 RepID=A0A835K6V9_9ROSI|nr:hypothetical protein SADUNF_Sadunf04G0097300 [Salix dunnii]